MATPHNIKKGETITFKTLQEIDDFGVNHQPFENEFKCISVDPFIFKKVN